jgi:response regulator RpfG family c-di-GMP phosphodiesterase
MSDHEVPNIVLLQDHDDANTVVAGVLSLKGCRVHKTNTLESCLSVINQFADKIDLVLIQKEIALSKNSMILRDIKEINPTTMILIVADNDGAKGKEDNLRELQIDGFVQTPISAENLADKILMLISKRELKRIKESHLKSE